MSAVILESTITCPHCGHAEKEIMPTDALLRELPLAVGQKLTGFGVLTRREDVLSEPAQAFCALLRKYATHGAHA